MRARDFTCPSGATLRTTEFGFGGAPLGNLFAAIPEPVAEATLRTSWDVGMRWYDTAPLYGLGLSEERIGRFLKDKPRDDYILSSKVGRVLFDCPPEQSTPDKFVDVPSRRFDYDYSHDGVMRAFEQTLERLQADRIDVVFCHDVDVFTHGTKEASDARIKEFMDGGYGALVSLRDQGVVKAIGAGVNEWTVAETMARAGDFDVFLLAGRYTLLEQEALESFLPLCDARGIGVLLGGPFNSGVLATGAVPGAKYNYAEAPAEIMEKVAQIETVCGDHGVRLIDAALRFPLGHDKVISVIPGARSPKEIDTLPPPEVPSAFWEELRAQGLIRADAPVPA